MTTTPAPLAGPASPASSTAPSAASSAAEALEQAGTGTTASAPTPLAPRGPAAVRAARVADLAADPADLQRLLDGRWAHVRQRSRSLLPAEWCAPTDHLGTDEQRALTRRRLFALTEHGEHRYGFSSAAADGGDSTGGQTVNFEMLGHVDLSLAIKSGVQWGLYAGSIQALGTARHHRRWLRDAVELRTLGCFAMTETGHGSDVASLETTATLDPATDELVVHTPTPSARKDYIGSAATDARVAVVFAQLLSPAAGAGPGGELVRHGVHAVVVPVRDETGAPLPGVTLSDCGRKEGLNGVDNGRITFDAVRVPREHLLDRFGSLAADGTYTSSLASANARFFTTLGALVKGRVCLSASSLASTRTALAIALRYAESRRQFPRAGGERGEEVTLLDYRTHQRRLLPALATTVALTVAQEELTAHLHRVTNPVLLGGSPDAAAQRELEAEAAGLKAVSTWHAVATVQAAREACGGAGYLSENRLAQLKADLDVFTTFEGDNTVLLQLLGKHLMGAYAGEVAAGGRVGAARAVAGSVVDAVASRTPARALASAIADAPHLLPGHEAEADLLDRAWQLRTLAWRERHLRASLAGRVRHARAAGADPFAASNEVADHLLTLARAHVDVVVASAVDAAIAATTDPRTRALLSALLDLHVLSRLEVDRAWYLERGWTTPARSRALVGAVDDLCALLRPHALRVVDAFALPPGWLGAAIVE